MRRGPETGAACSLQTPLEAKQKTSERHPIFATLDAMILAGWGDVPQNKIPHNWLECAPPSKFHAHALIDEARAVDVARIMLANQPGAIERVEAMNLESEGHIARAQQILEILRTHRGGTAERERSMRERQQELRREARSQNQRQAITRAWSDPEKFQSRRRLA